MPKSKTRPRAPRQQARPTPTPTPEASLRVATLALTEASLQIVREAELRIQLKVRAGEDTTAAIELHHYLRTASLGLLIAYSQLEGLPDPRQTAPTP